MVVAALCAWHEDHRRADAALAAVAALPAHAALEAYSVLTRLPGGLAVPAQDAAAVLSGRFPDAPLALEQRSRRALLSRLAEAGIRGGASYDALVGLEARQHGRALLTLDERAVTTYDALGIDHRPP